MRCSALGEYLSLSYICAHPLEASAFGPLIHVKGRDRIYSDALESSASVWASLSRAGRVGPW